MKILFIFHNNTLKGGAPKSGMTLLQQIRDLGHSVLAITPGESELNRELEKHDIEYRVIPFSTAWPGYNNTFSDALKYLPRYIRNRSANNKASKAIASIAKDWHADIIHSNSSVIDVGAKAASLAGIPHVYHFREYGMADTHIPVWHIYKILRNRSQYNIFITKDLRSYYNREDDANSIVIYNGVANSGSSESPSKDGYILFVGTIIPQKGVDDLINAYSKLDESLREQNPLLLAGTQNDISYLNHIKTECERLGVSQNIKFLGERSDIDDLMKKACCIVIPSFNEAFGRVMAEAAANRCLIIARDAKGLKEQFDNGIELSGGEIGFRFSDVDGLSEALRKAIAIATVEAEEITERAYQAAITLYGIENYGSRVEEFYKQIMQSK